jgi:hypothetical protein
MKTKKTEEEKKIKISITLNREINLRMEKDLTNKSRLIEKLLIEYYGKKNM